MAKYHRLGIYGGTFDPPHIGHLHAAKEFLRSCDLDMLYVVPTGMPPHKDGKTASEPGKRLEMVRLAFADPTYSDTRIEVSDFEQTRDGKSYTYHTLSHFKDEADELYLFCGEDMFLTLDSWYRAEDIFSLATVVCFCRDHDKGSKKRIESAAEHYQTTFGARILLPAFSPYPISSTTVRAHVQNGLSTDGFLTENVQAYIKEHKLYKR